MTLLLCRHLLTAAIGPFAIATSVFAADAEPELLDTSQYFHSDSRQTTLRGRVTGVFRDDVDAAFVFIALNCAGRRKYAYACSKDADRLLERLDALHGRDVAITGVEMPSRDRVVVSSMVLIRSLADIRIEDDTETDPFNVPDVAGRLRRRTNLPRHPRARHAERLTRAGPKAGSCFATAPANRASWSSATGSHRQGKASSSR